MSLANIFRQHICKSKSYIGQWTSTERTLSIFQNQLTMPETVCKRIKIGGMCIYIFSSSVILENKIDK